VSAAVTARRRAARVIVVEDHFAVADSLRVLLANEGFDVHGMAGTLAAAIALVERGGFDVAILDIQLGTDSIAPVAERLRDAGIPIVFLTGYGEVEILPEPLRALPRLPKPCDPDRLIALLDELVGEAGTPS
jgi:DNA-binding response OmpR family regulator